MAGKQELEIAQIAGEALGADRRVLPSRPAVAEARIARRGRHRRLADLPDLRLRGGLRDQGAVRQIELHRLFRRLGARRAAELDQQPGVAGRQQVERLPVGAAGEVVVDQEAVHPLEADRCRGEDLRDGLGGAHDVRIAEHGEHAGRGRRGEADGRLEEGDTGPLRAGEGAGEMEAALGEEVVEVEPRDPPREPWEALADQRGVAVAQGAELAVDLAAPPAGADDAVDLALGRRPHPQAEPLGGEDLQLLDVVRGAAGGQRVDAAGVVADHSADGAPAVGGGVGAEGEAVGEGGAAEVVEHRAGEHAGEPPLGVDREHPPEVARAVDHHRDVAALPGEAGAAPPLHDRRAMPPARRHRRDQIVRVPRADDADRHLPVVRGVGRIDRPVAGVEAHLAAHRGAEVGLEGDGVAGPGHW